MCKSETLVIISGYFNPLHAGHLDYIEGAKDLGDKLVVIVNNDEQQILKKGKIIMSEDDRARIVAALRDVDSVFMALDSDPTVCKTIDFVASNLGDEYNLIFANGGDRPTTKEVPETFVCRKHGIEMVFDAGGNEKVDSSTRVNKAVGNE
jgi:cytidyltransferase-like protein